MASKKATTKARQPTRTHKQIAKKAPAKKVAAKKVAAKKTNKSGSKQSVPKKAAPKDSKQAVAKKGVTKKAATGKAVARKAAVSRALPIPAELDRSSSIVPGSKAPEFRLQDQAGRWVTSKELRGAPYVLYFYPKDDTPGCTQEACDFRDAISAFKRAGAHVIGVSPDSVATHAKFSAKQRLPFTLLSDNSRELCNAYGAWVKKRLYGREYMGVERSTFVVGPTGLVRRVWRGVKVPGHAAAVLAAVRERG